MRKTIEGIGPNFNEQDFLAARDKTISTVRETFSLLEEGMNAEDITQIINDQLKKRDVQRLWHPSKVRIGKNTLLSFSKPSGQEPLQENDILFLDIGPVFNNHEGDYGETYVFGTNLEYTRISHAVKSLFNLCHQYWKDTKASGEDLYRFADRESIKLGYHLNMSMDGHRLSDWPHSLHYKSSLNAVDFSVSKNLWVLELLITHPNGQFGAFHEDLLL